MSETKSFWETFISSPAVFFIVMLFIFMGGFVAHAVYQKAVGVPSGGTIKSVNLDVWTTELKTELATFVEWGEDIETGSNVTTTLWVENTGTFDIVVNVYRNNTIPPDLVNYISFDWRLQLYAVDNRMVPEELRMLTLTITIAEDVPEYLIGDFSFDIWIVGNKAS